MENNNDEFELNFDDDVVDLTDPNRKTGGNGYGNYQGGYTQNDNIYGVYQGDNNRNDDIYGVYQGDNNRNDDIYGVYQPGQSYNNKAQTQNLYPSGDSVMGKIVNILYYLALFGDILYLGYFIVTKNYDMDLYLRLSKMVGVLFEVVILVDACTMYSRYKKPSLIVTAIIFPILYPFFRSSARSESKGIPALWLILMFVVAFYFVKDGMVPLTLSQKGHDLYESKYDTVMEKFKEYKYNKKTETGNVLGVWFDDYNLEVKKEEADYIYVKVSGQTDTELQGVVKTDAKIKPNTEMEFKVKKSDGSYTPQSLRLNNNLYNQYKDALWKYWYSNYEKALPW